MAKLIYAAIASLDGYVADQCGNFDWAAPDEELHAFVNDLERPIGTYLYGRRMYQVMEYWATAPTVESTTRVEPAVVRDFAQIWQAADKIVFSTTLATVATAKTQLVRRFDAHTVRTLKAAAPRDLSVGGPDLAAAAMAAGLVDECHLFLTPIIVGGGTRALPNHLLVKLQLLNERRFAGGVVHLHYRIAT